MESGRVSAPAPPPEGILPCPRSGVTDKHQEGEKQKEGESRFRFHGRSGKPLIIAQSPWRFQAILGAMRLGPVPLVLLLGAAMFGQDTSPDQLLSRAIEEQQKGDFTAAIRDYRALLAVRPETLAARLNLGAALAHTGQVDAAIANIRRRSSWLLSSDRCIWIWASPIRAKATCPTRSISMRRHIAPTRAMSGLPSCSATRRPDPAKPPTRWPC